MISINLPKHAVHIWKVSLDVLSYSVYEFQKILSDEERGRADRFCFEKDRCRYIVRVGILREILSNYTGRKPRMLKFCYGEHGKPRLNDCSGKSNIHFSLSHSEGLALYAFSRDYDLGIDIELIRSIPEMEQIIKLFFSEKEKVAFEAILGNEKLEAFFKYWTRKEAFIKAMGDGLYRPLDSFDISMISPEAGVPIRISENSKIISKCFIYDFIPAPRFSGALAILGQNFEVFHINWSEECQITF